MNTTISSKQALYFARQINVPGFDIDAQEALLNATALLVGLGGLGSACFDYLCGSGIGTLHIIDRDEVEIHNFHRQRIHKVLGKSKVQSAKDSVEDNAPYSTVIPHHKQATLGWLDSILPQCDVIIDCSDNLSTRNLLNESSLKHKKPLISGAAIQWEGQVSVFNLSPTSPCYACLSRNFSEPELNCSENGIISPVVGIIGVTMALEILKLLSSQGELLDGKLATFDGKSGRWQEWKINKDVNCTKCSSS